MLSARLLSLLLACCVGTASKAAEPPQPERFVRTRLGVFSSGPRGLPTDPAAKPIRTDDPQIAPSTFQTFSSAKPTLSDDPWEIGTAETLDEANAANAAADKTGAEAEATETEAPIDHEPSEPAVGMRLGAARSNDSGERPTRPTGPLAQLSEWRPSSEALTATGGALALSIGLLLSLTWVIRKSMPRSSRPLPKEIVQTLGRAPLAGRQSAQLLRIGNKLVLVAVTPEGAETLTEITDPEEVSRLLAACEEHNGQGSEFAFEQVFRQMASEPARGFLDEPAYDAHKLAAAYAHTPGGQGRG